MNNITIDNRPRREYMESFDLYQDIATRTNGDIYIGVVGPVRTGKSTFIKRFMDKMVLPYLSDQARKQRIIDELPQSADGKIVMTTQPKFVPDGGVKVVLGDNVAVNVRLIDCVGYLIDNLEGESRKVRTPWSSEEMTFEQASELGTRKVMSDHSTIGILVTTDGTITDFERVNYLKAEERIAQEMKQLGKPFVILLNTKKPRAEETLALCGALREKYGVPVITKSAFDLELEDIQEILEACLCEFPIRKINFTMPRWLQMMDRDNAIISKIIAECMEKSADIVKMSEYRTLKDLFCQDDNMKQVANVKVSFGSGSITVDLLPQDKMFYRIMSEECDVDISDEFTLFKYIREASFAEKQFCKLKGALEDVETRGYGIVLPTDADIVLEAPQFMTGGSKGGVKMAATASCLHIMKVNVNTEVNPIVGSGTQAQEMVNYLRTAYEGKEMEIWDTNMFGKSLNSIAKEGINNKMYSMPQEAQAKLRKVVTRIVNEGRGGVLCVLL